MSSQKNFVHPFTFTVVSLGVETPVAYLNADRLTEALTSIADFTLVLDPEIKATLREEIDELREMRRNRAGMNEDRLWDVMDKIYNALHEAGYFLGAKMTPPTVKTGLGDLAKKLEGMK